MEDFQTLRARAREWVAQDPDPATRAEVQQLLDQGDDAALAERFSGRLSFGTAGIRGPLGAGPLRMNRALVRAVTAGLAARLGSEPGARQAGVVVGRDARHGSAGFAEEVAAVLAGAGFTVHRFAEVVPTPLVAFAVRALGAAAGVQITASHNPPADNGYKVYWADGAQIRAPLDTEIAAAIAAVGDLRGVRLGAADDARILAVPEAVVGDYVRAALAARPSPAGGPLPIVYTPLHGVAGKLCTAVLATAGFTDVRVVPAQADPDPDFPTVGFPNPEEEGALDQALALAAATGAGLVLANDPDGDRIAAAVPQDGGWRVLAGDEVGCLLGDYLLARSNAGPRVVATTVVSSRLLARIAAAHGARYVETLTGFKWLAPVAADAAARGERFVLAYEQALGVMVGDAVRDKDGISAAVVLADLVAELAGEGRTVADALDRLALQHGVHATAGRAVRLDEPGAADRHDGPAPGPRLSAAQLADAAMAALRADPPATLGGIPVVAVADHVAGVHRGAGGQAQELPTPPTDLLGLDLADGARVQVRPSGTEPVLKCYVEVVEPVAAGDVAAARAGAARRLTVLAAAAVDLVRERGLGAAAAAR